VYFCVCLIVVLVPPGKTPFAVQLNNMKFNNILEDVTLDKKVTVFSDAKPYSLVDT
jgi:hypothetical protein